MVEVAEAEWDGDVVEIALFLVVVVVANPNALVELSLPEDQITDSASYILLLLVAPVPLFLKLKAPHVDCDAVRDQGLPWRVAMWRYSTERDTAHWILPLYCRMSSKGGKIVNNLLSEGRIPVLMAETRRKLR